MAVKVEGLPTYHVSPTVSLAEVTVHATRRYNATGVEQLIVDEHGIVLDIVGCQHEFVTKHYGRPLVCDRCSRFKDDESGEWKVRRLGKVTPALAHEDRIE